MEEREISVATRPTRAQISRLIRRQLLASRPALFTVAMGFAGPLLLYALHLTMAGRSPPPAPSPRWRTSGAFSPCCARSSARRRRWIRGSRRGRSAAGHCRQ